MQRYFSGLKILTFVTITALTGCAPKATPPSVDAMAATLARAAFDQMTQTAAAASPTPNVTTTPMPTKTPREPTPVGYGKRPMTTNYAACWLGGPGPPAALDSNIKKGMGNLALLGIGSVPGWYIIRNPYFHRPCWIAEADLKIFDGTHMGEYPVMTPGVPPMGQ